MQTDAPIFVAGHRGLVGSALVRRLEARGFDRLITRTRSDLDLTDRASVNQFFAVTQPKHVFLAAAKVGGIQANDIYAADFIRENLLIQTHVIDAAFHSGVEKLCFLGSSCIYPKHAPQPMSEDCLLTGPLESTNSAYAIAKIAGLEMCQAYHRQYGFKSVCLMPTNLYGPHDNFDLETSHVLPALIRKFDDALRSGADAVTVWGSGTPRREFLHADDLADAAIHLMETHDDPGLVNVGTGVDVSIAELADLIREATGFEGAVRYDTTKPDGTPRKLLDVSKLGRLGWQASISLEEGIRRTIAWYRATGSAAPAASDHPPA